MDFPKGTHVGFQDQVVLGQLEVVPDILPVLIAAGLSLVTGSLWPWLGGIVMSLGKRQKSQEEHQTTKHGMVAAINNGDRNNNHSSSPSDATPAAAGTGNGGQQWKTYSLLKDEKDLESKPVFPSLTDLALKQLSNLGKAPKAAAAPSPQQELVCVCCVNTS